MCIRDSPNTTVAFRMNNLSGSTSGLILYAYGADGATCRNVYQEDCH